MVDEEIFSRRLDALAGYLAQAERLGEVDEDAFLAEPAIHDLAERYLHLAAEATIDLARLHSPAVGTCWVLAGVQPR